MKQSVEFQQICYKNNHRVQAYLSNQGTLNLRISKNDAFTTKVYEKKLNSLKDLDDQMSLYYSNFQEIIQFIKDPSNITIGEGKNTSKKESTNQSEANIIFQIIEGQSLKQVIAQVNLPFLNKVQNQGSCCQTADAISRICDNNGQLNLSQVKQLFKAVAGSLKTIGKRKQNEGENIFVLKQQTSEPKDKKPAPEKVKQKQFGSIQKKFSAMQLQNKQMFESFQKLIRSSIEDAKNKLSKKVSDDIEKQVKAQFQQIRKLMQKLPQKVGESLIIKLNGSKPELEQIKTDIQNLKQIIKQSKSSTLKKKLTLKQNSVAPSTWLQKQFNHSFKINIENNFIIAHSPVNIFGTFDNTKDGQEHIKKFKVYIANMKQYIGVGLADDKYRTQKQMGNNLVKLGNNGHVFDGNSEQFSKQGFCEGQEILVKLNTKTGEVSWSVDGQIRYSVMVKKGIKSFIPLIVMLNKYDAVCIMKN